MSATLRSLADDLRNRSDLEITGLLSTRPDLENPVPTSIGDLAKRANTADSVTIALEALTATDLTVLSACCALVPDNKVTTEVLSTALASDTEPVAEALERLWRMALIWGPDEDLRAPASVREIMGPHPCGLDQVNRPVDEGSLQRVVVALQTPGAFEEAPSESQELLRELTWQTPVIASLGGSPTPAAIWLFEQGILKQYGESSFVLPRESSLALRHGSLLATPLPAPPTLSGKEWPAHMVAASGAHAADQYLRSVDRLVQSTRLTPRKLVSTGGLEAREWRDLADSVRMPQAEVAGILELTAHAGWLADNGSGYLCPTTRYAQTEDDPRERRWALLARAWLSLTIEPQDLVESDSGAVTTPLSTAATHGEIPITKRLLLQALESGGASIQPSNIVPWMVWRRPKLNVPPTLVQGLGREAENLGITGLGTLTIPGDQLLSGASRDEVATALQPQLPAETERILLQHDLTATATAPLTASTERRLRMAADFESGGGATVYRFTPSSISRALAYGEQPDELARWLTRVSDSGLPKAIEVIIDDAARTQGEVQIAPAASVIHTTPETIDRILEDPALAGFDLVPLSSDVVFGSTEVDQLAAALQSAGYTTHKRATHTELAHTTQPAPSSQADDPRKAALRERIVSALRGVEDGQLSDAAPIKQELEQNTSGGTVQEQATDAIDQKADLWLEFSDPDGHLMIHLVQPVTLKSGHLTVFDRSTATIGTIAIARVLRAWPPTAN